MENNISVMYELQQFREEISARMDSFEEKQNEMLALLRGQPINPEDRGLIGKVNSHSKRILSLERFKDRGIYIVVGISIGAGYGIGTLVLKLFFNH